jgi:hypothetical protein
METTGEGMSKTTEIKVGDKIYYKYIFNKFNPKNKEKSRESTESENSNQKLITKYPAPKARKRDVAKTTTKTKYRFEVAANSIIVVIVT